MELTLIELTWNVKDGAVDFTIPSKNDHIVKKNKEELVEKLELLTNALKNESYPFGNL